MTKKSSSSSDSTTTTASTELLFKLVWLGGIVYGIGFFLYYAYEIRLQAIKEFGPVVHEFDPPLSSPSSTSNSRRRRGNITVGASILVAKSPQQFT